MWELDCKEGWVSKNWCFWTLVLEKTLESPLGCKIKQVNPKGNQSWIFIRRTDANLKLQYFGHLMQRTDSLEKTLMLGNIEGRRRRGQQRMRWLDGITDSVNKFEQVLGDGEGQGALAYCSPRGRKKSDTTKWLNWTELNWTEVYCLWNNVTDGLNLGKERDFTRTKVGRAKY